MPAEDVGDTPLELLQPVLLRCNAEQLTSIEDGTRRGLLLSSQRAVTPTTISANDLLPCTGMGGENCMRRYYHTGREYTLLNLAAGTVLLPRFATGPARGDCKFNMQWP